MIIMNKIFLIVLALGIYCHNAELYSQVSTNYLFSQSQGTYQEITGDTIVASATHTSIDPFQLNDVTYNTNHLPFIFKFNGINYTDFKINSNGFITFGSTPPVQTNYGPISSSESYERVVSAFGQNLIGVFGTTADFVSTTFILTNVANFKGVVAGRHITAATGIKADTYIVSFDTTLKTITLSKPTDDIIVTGLVIQIAAGSIVRSTEGTAPYRVHTIQFKNFRQFLIIGTDDNFNFQIKLYETSGVIKVVYGNMNEITSSGIFGQVGLRGNVNTDFNNRTNSVSLDWAASTAGTANAATSKLSSSIFPVSGQTYIWSPVPVSLNISFIQEAFYNPVSEKLNLTDTVNIYLRNNTSPYNLVDSAEGLLDSSTLTANVIFNNANSGTYYIQVNHRNCIETWSKSGGEIITAGITNYNFTSLQTRAYGNNEIQVDASPVRFAIYSGDVNQDGTIDLTDGSLIDNDASNFATGYLPTDVNGDWIVDVADAVFADNNAFNFISKITP